jgi:hypothetical protein
VTLGLSAMPSLLAEQMRRQTSSEMGAAFRVPPKAPVERLRDPVPFVKPQQLGPPCCRALILISHGLPHGLSVSGVMEDAQPAMFRACDDARRRITVAEIELITVDSLRAKTMKDLGKLAAKFGVGAGTMRKDDWCAVLRASKAKRSLPR